MRFTLVLAASNSLLCLTIAVKSLLADAPISSLPKKKSKKRTRQEASSHIDEQSKSAGSSERTVDLEVTTSPMKARRLSKPKPARRLIDEDVGDEVVEVLGDRRLGLVLEKEGEYFSHIEVSRGRFHIEMVIFGIVPASIY